MSRVCGALDIARPVDVVFDAVADQRNEPTYNRHMTASTKVTPGPIGLGTRFSWDWTVTLTGPAWFAGPLVGLIGRRQERRTWTGLKDCLEDGHKAS